MSESTPTKFDLYKAKRDELTYEASLIMQRTTWMVLSQSFLFGSLAAGFDRVEPFVNGDNLSLADSLFFPVLPFVGLAVTLICAVSIQAGNRAADAIREELNADYSDYFIKRGTRTVLEGLLPSTALPYIFIAAWLWVIFSGYGVKW